MSDQTTRDEKLIQLFNEAYAKERNSKSRSRRTSR